MFTNNLCYGPNLIETNPTNDQKLIFQKMIQKIKMHNAKPNGIVQATHANPLKPMSLGMNIQLNANLNDVMVTNQKLVSNDAELENSGIKPFGDEVFHISEAIIASAFNLRDKKLMSNEKKYTEEEVKNKIISLANTANENINSMPLSALPNLIKNETTALKRATTRLWAKFCADAFNKIKSDKRIQKYVDDLSDALIEYSKSMTKYSENEAIDKCKNIMLKQG